MRERGRKRDKEREGEREGGERESERKGQKQRQREGEREGRESELLDTYVTPTAQGHLRTNHTFTVTPQKAETQCIKHSNMAAHSSSVFDTKNQ